MKYQDEYRQPDVIEQLLDQIQRQCTRPHRVMEVCGGQTHAFMRFGLEERLPPLLTLLHGPGCPVCVTPVSKIDQAIEIAQLSNVILATFGDMLRVPGSATDLQRARAEGADVRMVYSPLEALKLATQNPSKQVVFFGVGFETTAPAVAMTAWQARELKLRNFSLLVAHVLVPPAIEALLQDEQNPIDGFLAAGHVCTIMGTEPYESLVTRHRVPIVVTGFEPVELLNGLLRCVVQLEHGDYRLENAYARVVAREGNPHARKVMETVFEAVDQEWRGLGRLPLSGLELAPAYRELDASSRFNVLPKPLPESDVCKSGLVLQGKLKPSDCPQFGVRCTPEQPLGATMVSSEGACAAWFRYRRNNLAGGKDKPSHPVQDV